jgi:PPP family 3-phenylpropionic acid transporter
MKKLTSSAFYFLYFGAVAALMPYFVLYYQSLGFNGMQIGLLTGISPLVTIVGAPLWTGGADATRKHRLFLTAALAGSILITLALPTATVFGLVFPLILLYYFFLSPISSFADHATMSMLAGEKEKYGRVRMGGTLGWGLVAPLAGFLIQNNGLRIGFWIFSALLFLALLISQGLSFHGGEAGSSMRKGIRTLLADRRWLPFLALAFLGGMGLAAINGYLFPFMEEMNAGNATMGIALSLSTLSEVPMLFFANRLIRVWKAEGLLLFGMLAMGVRLLLYPIFNFPLGVLFFQMFNGLTFPAIWVAGVSFADQNSPPGMRATAQGLFAATVFGFGSAAGGFLGGPLLEGVGGRGLYLVFGLLLLLGTGAVAMLSRYLRGIPHPEIPPRTS